MKCILIFATIFMVQIVAPAQDRGKSSRILLENRVGLAVGIGSVTYLDKSSSPLVYQSRPKNLRLFYSLEGKSFLVSLGLDMRMGGNEAKYHKDRTLIFHEEDYLGNSEDKKIPVMGSLMAGKISVGGYYKIPSVWQSTLKLAIGGQLMNELFYPQGWTTGGLFNALSIGPAALAKYQINENHSLSASVQIPLATRLTRLPYDNTVSRPNENIIGAFFQNSQWVGLKKFLSPAMALGYNYEIGQKWGVGLNYEFSWYRIQQPQPFRAVSQSVLANFYRQF